MSLKGLILASLTYLHLVSDHGRVDALPLAIIIICWLQIISTCQLACKHRQRGASMNAHSNIVSDHDCVMIPANMYLISLQALQLPQPDLPWLPG